jgi:malonate-semialdehyde dehydrogenase (acetylating) / methylmalonate-semialdehyde dehydrogenase
LTGHLVAGQRRPGRSGRTSPVFDPATGTQTGSVDLAGPDEVDDAVAAASEAFEGWGRTSLAERTRLMFRFRALLDARADDVAALITAEHGKTLDDARGEVARGLDNVDYACGVAELLKGSVSEQAATGIDVISVRRPLGVVAGITPFNFPAMVPLWTIPNAVACGNAYVLKPSERDPSAPMLLAELFHEAGFPPGVLNVVNGDRVAVDHLLGHPDVRAISFVGSTDVARHVHLTASANAKRVQALGGAKNHMVVLPDADLGLAADGAVSAAFGSAGERCMAVSVVVAVGDVADPLIEAISQRIDGLVVGPGDDPATEMGPLITAQHRDRVAGYVDAAAGEGASVVVDGRERTVDHDGFFLGPSLLDRVTPTMAAYRDEIFGPVLSVVRVGSYAEAVALLAANRWGNGAAIYTRDGGAARRFQQDADAGMVGVNVPIPVPIGAHSFGGWKDSLFGDTAMYGPEGVRFFTKQQVSTVRWPDPADSAVDLGFPRSG